MTRRPVRSLLTMLGVGFAVGSFIALYGLSRSVDENAQQLLDERGVHLTISKRGSAEFFGGTLPQALVPKLAVIPGISAMTGELFALVLTEGDAQILALGWAEDSFLWSSVPLQEGRLPQPGERKVALLGNNAATALGKRVGDRIVLLGEQFPIIGITRYASVIGRNAVVVPLEDLQEVTFRSGAVTVLQARVSKPDNFAEIERISRAIEGMADVVVSTSDAVLRNDYNLGLLRAVSSAMAWVALLMGVLMVLNTLLMAVLERTREMGILCAIGWSQPRIMGSLVIEGFILTLVGSLAGVLIGLVGSHLLSTVSAIGRYATVRPTPALVVATALAAIALGFLGSLYPAWMATRQDPATALERT